MKTLYFDCGMGVAGDMLTAALYDLLSDEQKNEFMNTFKGLNIPGVTFDITKSVKCGITGSHVTVKVNGEEEISEDYHEHHDHDHDHSHHEHDHEHTHHDHEHHDHEHTHHDDHHHHHHHHTSYSEICSLIDSFSVNDKVKENTKGIYKLIADAESKVHGVDVSEIHFHEVGSLDAVADIMAVCILFDMIGADKVYASAVHVGSGKVRCAHGILPVPAPATAEILRGIPVYGGRVQGELCTPTGAALLKYFVDEFGDMPVMAADRIGYGMGNKDFEAANCVRVILSESDKENDSIIELDFNVDDMTGEEIGFLTEVLMTNGARDVFSVPVVMKKSRPGNLICVLCTPADKAMMVELIMKHSTTIGIREKVCKRNILRRSIKSYNTEYGPVRVKESDGYGAGKRKIEFEDLAGISRATGLSIYEIREKLNLLF